MIEDLNSDTEQDNVTSTSGGLGFLSPTSSDQDELSPSQSEKASAALTEGRGESAQQEQRLSLKNVVRIIDEKFNKAKTYRRSDEDRWLDAYNNYRGVYEAYTDKEKSKATIKITKTKVHAAYAQITEVLFAGQKFPIGIIPSKIPFGVASKLSINKDPKSQDPNKQADRVPLSGLFDTDILEKAGIASKKIEEAAQKGLVKEGATGDPEEVVFEPNKAGSELMEMNIQDQLAESNANKEIRNFCFDLSLFGHGVVKGPLGETIQHPYWDNSGKYKPREEFEPRIKHVSIWDFYPDPDARKIEEAEYTIQRHRFSKTQLRDLKRQKNFISSEIDYAINMGSDYTPEYWENQLEDSSQDRPDNRYEVLEYWGYVDKTDIDELDIDVPKEFDEFDQMQANIWTCNGVVIRAVLNPFKPMRIPYHSCPYELNPYSFFGIGVAENMKDTQLIMNGFMRMMIDNAALSSNIILEVDEDSLSPGQSMDIYPGKVFKRMSGAPGQAIFATKFNNVTNECMLVFDKARQLADEATGMPSYSHGMSGVQNVGRTASGMSMLMGAAAQNIKSVVRNIDDYLLVPLGKDMVAFNMQFNYDKKFVSDIEVVARGTESLMRNEVRSQKILQFLQLTANPLDAPLTKREYLLKELSKSLDLDPELTINNTKDAKVRAMLYSEMQGLMTPPGQEPQGGPAPQPPQGVPQLGGIAGESAGIPAPQGAETGGVGPATPQLPDEQGFSGNI